MEKKCSNNRIPADIVPDDAMFIPMYKTPGSAAADLVANIEPDGAGRREIKIGPGHIVTIDCGFRMALKPGWEVQIRARSGLARQGIQVTNGIGTIDEDYRGRVQVILNNAGREIVVIKHGDRIAQAALKPVYYFAWNVVTELDDTTRGQGGFGSTGK
jgi:dUTP pyrophosphatase